MNIVEIDIAEVQRAALAEGRQGASAGGCFAESDADRTGGDDRCVVAAIEGDEDILRGRSALAIGEGDGIGGVNGFTG